MSLHNASTNSQNIGEMGRRIAQARKNQNLSQKEFGQKIGLSDSQISRLEAGKGNPKVAILSAIEKELGISRRWLETGKGDWRAEVEQIRLESKSGIDFEAEIEAGPVYFAKLLRDKLELSKKAGKLSREKAGEILRILHETQGGLLGLIEPIKRKGRRK